MSRLLELGCGLSLDRDLVGKNRAIHGEKLLRRATTRKKGAANVCFVALVTRAGTCKSRAVDIRR